MKEPVRIEKAKDTGFCCGVKRAISLLEEAAKTSGGVETLGPVVHNPQVVESLTKHGVRQVSSLDDVTGKLVAITAHGTDPATLSDINRRKLQVIDTTCAIVRNAQKVADRLSKEGYGIAIFGDPEHTEVKGLLGWSGKKARATTEPQEIIDWQDMPRRLAIIPQSTQDEAAFGDFVKKILDSTLPRLREVRIFNSICPITRQRQDAARELAGKCDLIIVVGGKNSANSKRLAETCQRLVKTHFVEAANEIRKSWLKGHKHIGVVAGTSTPEHTVEEVVNRLRELVGG